MATTSEIPVINTPLYAYPTRALNTAYQVSATRNAFVVNSIQISCTLSISGGQTGTVVLEICPNSAFSSGVQEIGEISNGNTGTLTVGLNIVQTLTQNLCGRIPAGYYYRMRTVNNTGTPTFTWKSAQEVTI